MIKSNNSVIFDIESGGLQGKGARPSSLFQYAIKDATETRSHFALPTKGTYVYNSIEDRVLNIIADNALSQNNRPLPEQALLRQFMVDLQTSANVNQQESTMIGMAHKKPTLTGWNIGQHFDFKNQRFLEGYDLNFLLERADRYGMKQQFLDALTGYDIKDAGHKFKNTMANLIAQGVQDPSSAIYASANKMIQEDFGGRFSSFTEAYGSLSRMSREARNQYLESIGKDVLPSRYSSLAQMYGYALGETRPDAKVAGWSLDTAARTLEAVDPSILANAHLADVDVDITSKVIDSFDKFETDPLGVFNRWVDTVAGQRDTKLEAARQSGKPLQGMGVAEQEAMRHLNEDSLSLASGKRVQVVSGFADEAAAAAVKPKPTVALSDFFSNFKGYIPYLAGAIGASYLISNAFSGRDDSYNTIEGLGHSGIGQIGRHALTDFGSGYQIGSEVTSQLSDGMITDDEVKKLKRILRSAIDQQTTVEIMSKSKVESTLARLNAIGDVTLETGLRPGVGSLGAFKNSNNTLFVGTEIDPADLLEELDSPGADINKIYTAISPGRLQATVLHEGLHATWKNEMDDSDKLAFIQHAKNNLNSKEVQDLSKKSATYNQVIQEAKRGDEGSLEWLANEMFAHRGVSFIHSEQGYIPDSNERLDDIATSYGDLKSPLSDPSPFITSGVVLPEDVMQFRRENVDRKYNRDALIDMRESNSTKWDDFAQEDMKINKAGTKATVDLSKFDLKWDDADTVVASKNGRNIAIRLHGIDAPEVSHDDDPLAWLRVNQSQPGGDLATDAVKRITEGKQLYATVDLDPKSRTYNRYVGKVGIKNESSVQEQLLAGGFVSTLKYPGDDGGTASKYKALQEEARAEEKGIWAHPFHQVKQTIADASPTQTTYNAFTDKYRLASDIRLAAANVLMNQAEAGNDPDPKLIERIRRRFKRNNTSKKMEKQQSIALSTIFKPGGGRVSKE